MRTISREELEKILINHQHWINEDCEGWEGMRADLSNANLSNANLRNADLSNADLRNANLSNADLWNANLRNANLRNANLSNADLRNADLSNADLSNADLWNADLRNANLRNANLRNANLRNADLSNALNIPFIPMACPDTGSFIAWKKAQRKIVKLFVPSDARRLSATGRKCRCDKATVIAIENIDGTPADVTEIHSDYDYNFIYKIHTHLTVDNFCEDRWKECAEGIHFFINRQEAVDY